LYKADAESHGLEELKIKISKQSQFRDRMPLLITYESYKMKANQQHHPLQSQDLAPVSPNPTRSQKLGCMDASASAAKTSAGDGNEGAQPKGQALHTTPDVVAAD